MKNDFSKTCLRRFSLVLGLVFSAWTSPSAIASPELDRQYALTSVGVLRAWDNVDGLFGDLVNQVFVESLSSQSRFVVQDLSKASPILQSSSIAYGKLIEDPEVLGQMARTFRLDSFIRTRAYKEGPQYRFVLEWVHAPKLQLLATETIQVEQPFRGEGRLGTDAFRSSLREALQRLIGKVPFKGSVTGRDQTAITINLGTNSGVARGDTLVLATLDDVKYHPLLKTVVDWRLTPVGRAVVDEVEEGMAFAKIETEEYGRQIQRFQKVVQIIPAPEQVTIDKRSTDLEALEKSAGDPPRMGYLSPGLLLGSTGRDTGTTSGGGFLYGAKVDLQAWMTSDWFGEFHLTRGTAGYSHETLATGATTYRDVSLNLSQVRFAVGYFYHVTSNFFGPKGWAKLGYQSTNYRLPQSATERTGPVSYSGLYLGVGGDLPVRKDYGVILDAELGLFGSATEESGLSGTVSSSNHLNVFAGGYVWMQPKMKFQFGIDFKSNSVDFVTGSSISNKTFAVSPSVLFYF